MREIKFRAWNGKKMTKDFSLYSDGTIASRIAGFTNNKPLVLLQYIGLKDASGREIYEGDILRDQFGQTAECRSFVDEAHCMSGFHLVDLDKNRKGGWSVFDGSWLKIGAEIIGNIYENPELLKGGTDET